MFRCIGAVLLIGLWALPGWAEPFNHQRWDQLLTEHVYPVRDGLTSEIDYQGFSEHRDELRVYLDQLAAVDEVSFNRWSRDEQLAFLINAYNAWTVELILTGWPEIGSIKELGSWLRQPWSREFIPLLGQTRSLDEIEHQLIRRSGQYNDVRIHFALNCASIGCPALRTEAYRAEQLDRQLGEQAEQFLRDRSRNRAEADTLYLSSIFRWYREDFEQNWQGIDRLETFLIRQAEVLGLNHQQVQKLQLGELELEFLPYDWGLNQRLR